MAGDGAGDVDEVHHGAAEDEPERVRVVRQHDLHHLGRESAARFGARVHRDRHDVQTQPRLARAR